MRPNQHRLTRLYAIIVVMQARAARAEALIRSSLILLDDAHRCLHRVASPTQKLPGLPKK